MVLATCKNVRACSTASEYSANAITYSNEDEYQKRTVEQIARLGKFAIGKRDGMLVLMLHLHFQIFIESCQGIILLA